MTASQRAKLKRAINELVRASIAESWKGCAHPNDVPALERELARAKRRVDDTISSIAVSANDPHRAA